MITVGAIEGSGHRKSVNDASVGCVGPSAHTIPTHLVIGQDVSAAVARFYAHVCPAGVYEEANGALRINAPNCVDCKATDALGPTLDPRAREGAEPSCVAWCGRDYILPRRN